MAIFNMGLYVSIYRDADGVDCTADGVTSPKRGHTQALLVGPGVDGPFTIENAQKSGIPVLVFVPRPQFGPYAIPLELTDSDLKPSNKVWAMFGGNFVFTTDSRFSKLTNGCPLSVHDRVER